LSKYYVLLTGAKNNAGDFLIRERAITLLRRLRPDRELVNLDGWRPITDEQLELVNGAEALLLTGGPSVRPNMRPDIYALRPRLSDVRVPITTLGVGWRGPTGDWALTRHAAFSPASRELLERIREDGLRSSVRDYHTLNVLRRAGIGRVVMTGCPAVYAPDVVGGFRAPERLSTVSVSVGVRMAESAAMWRQTLALLRATRQAFEGARVVAVFHHSTDEAFTKAYGRPTPLFEAQRRLLAWLDSEGFEHVDVSGSAESMKVQYDSSDLHVGYRVHAHIYMTSMMRPSLLLAEDSRGSALKEVLGGHIVEAIEGTPNRIAAKVGRTLRSGLWDIKAPEAIAYEAVELLKGHLEAGWCKAKNATAAIAHHRPTMEAFVASLP